MGLELGNSYPARVLIVDDHALVREGMQMMLSGEPGLKVVGQAENGRQAVLKTSELRPDLVLMDVRMPEMDGLSATREIKKDHTTTSVLIVTTHDDPDYLLEAVEAGAAGYITKDATKPELLDTVRRVMEGESPMDPKISAELLRRLVRDRNISPPVYPAPETLSKNLPDSLTTRESEILQLLAPGRTNKEIAAILVVSPGTVKNHVQHIIKKLGVSDRTQAAIRAFEAGLVTSGETNSQLPRRG